MLFDSGSCRFRLKDPEWTLNGQKRTLQESLHERSLGGYADDLGEPGLFPKPVTLRAQEDRSQNCIAWTLKLEPVLFRLSYCGVHRAWAVKRPFTTQIW